MHQLDYMRLHAAALYRIDAAGRLVSSNRWDNNDLPMVHLATSPAGHFWLFRHDLPENACITLGRLVPSNFRDSPQTEFENRCTTILAEYVPVGSTRHGPAFRFGPVPQVIPTGITRVTPSNAGVLERHMADWLPDVPHCQPFFAVLDAGHAVSVCASVRISDHAHEAGVETIPTFRARGHARMVTSAWAAAVAASGAEPLYSTSWENVASQRVAAALGLELIGADFSMS